MLNGPDGISQCRGGGSDDSQQCQGDLSREWSFRKVAENGEAGDVTKALRKSNEQSDPALGQASNNGLGLGGRTITKQADSGEQTRVGYQQFSSKQSLFSAFSQYFFRTTNLGFLALERMIENGEAASDYTEVMRFTYCDKKYLEVELDTGDRCLLFRQTGFLNCWIPFPGWFTVTACSCVQCYQTILDPNVQGGYVRQYGVPIYQKISEDLLEAERSFLNLTYTLGSLNL